jgi:hypothetical protein
MRRVEWFVNFVSTANKILDISVQTFRANPKKHPLSHKDGLGGVGGRDQNPTG